MHPPGEKRVAGISRCDLDNSEAPTSCFLLHSHEYVGIPEMSHMVYAPSSSSGNDSVSRLFPDSD